MVCLGVQGVSKCFVQWQQLRDRVQLFFSSFSTTPQGTVPNTRFFPTQTESDMAENTDLLHCPEASDSTSHLGRQRGGLMISMNELTDELKCPPHQHIGSRPMVNLSEPVTDTENKSRVQIQLFEAKHAISVRNKRPGKDPAAVEAQLPSAERNINPTDVLIITEEELNERFNKDNPDIKGEIKLTGVDLAGLMRYSVLKLEKTKCISISMPSFGLFNKILLLTFDDNTVVLARIPFSITRAKMLSMKSEIATMTYIRLNRPSIPVAQVYAYEANVDNPAKVPFMLIEKMPGVHIYDYALYDKDSPKAEQVLKNIAKVQAVLAEPLPFNMIGNLFFTNDLPAREKREPETPSYGDIPGYTWPDTPGDENLGTTESGMGEGFEIGPLVFENPYDSEVIASGEAGPFKSLKDLVFFLIQHQRVCSEKVWRSILKESDSLPPLYEWSSSPGTLSDFTKRCLQLCAAVHALKIPDEYSDVCFYHWDLRMGNILIDESTLEVTAVLDWDDVRVVPMLFSATHPEEIREMGCWNEPTKYIIPETNTAAENQAIERWWWREHYRYNMCMLDARFAIGGGQIWEEAETAHRLYKLLFTGYNEWLAAQWVA